MMGCMPRLVDSSDFFILEGRGALFCYGQGIEGSNFINRERLIDSDFFSNNWKRGVCFCYDQGIEGIY